MSLITLDAPAKLNLFLHVGKKRKDSYHNLVTVFERIDLKDRITLSSVREDKVELSSDSPSIPNDSNNIAVKAALSLKERFGIRKGVSIHIAKRIPVAAGLGGGSSDAASVILGLARLWKIKVSRKILLEIGVGLGADVPFFLKEVPFAYAEGVGDRLLPWAKVKHEFWHVLAVPDVFVSTREVYESYDRVVRRGGNLLTLTAARRNVKMMQLALSADDVARARGFLYNDLEAVTLKRYPLVRSVKKAIETEAGGVVRMSGSGPSLFTIFDSRAKAVIFRKKIAGLKGCRLFLSRTF